MKMKLTNFLQILLTSAILIGFADASGNKHLWKRKRVDSGFDVDFDSKEAENGRSIMAGAQHSIGTPQLLKLFIDGNYEAVNEELSRGLDIFSTFIWKYLLDSKLLEPVKFLLSGGHVPWAEIHDTFLFAIESNWEELFEFIMDMDEYASGLFARQYEHLKCALGLNRLKMLDRMSETNYGFRGVDVLINYDNHLHMAVEADNVLLAEILLKFAHFSVDDADRDGDTPLHFTRSVGMTKLLMKYNPNLEFKNDAGETALDAAINFGNYDIVKIISSDVHARLKKLSKLRHGSATLIKVDRKTVLEDSFVLTLKKSAEWYKPYQNFDIQFVDESGIDNGGLTREWISLLIARFFVPRVPENVVESQTETEQVETTSVNGTTSTEPSTNEVTIIAPLADDLSINELAVVDQAAVEDFADEPAYESAGEEEIPQISPISNEMSGEPMIPTIESNAPTNLTFTTIFPEDDNESYVVSDEGISDHVPGAMNAQEMPFLPFTSGVSDYPSTEPGEQDYQFGNLILSLLMSGNYSQQRNIVPLVVQDHERVDFFNAPFECIDSENKSFRISPNFIGSAEVYKFIGSVIAKSLFHKIPLGVKLAPSLLKQLFGKPLNFEDLKDDDPVMYNGLKTCLKADFDFESCDFALLSNSGIKVNADNVMQYVEEEAYNAMYLKYAPQIDAFIFGFRSIYPLERLQALLSEQELSDALQGEEKVDRAQLREIIKIVGAEWQTREEIFWAAMDQLLDGELADFIRFCTAIRGIPYGGITLLPKPITVNDERRYSTMKASTCSFIIYIPTKITTTEQLLESIRIALASDQGFSDYVN